MSNDKTSELHEYLKQVPTGFLTDSFRRLGLTGWIQGVTPITRKKNQVAGRAVTVEYSHKRSPARKTYNLYEIINECGPGDVLVLGAFGTESWTLGENTVHAALYQEMEGLVIDGCVRDSSEISAMDIPVLCRGVGIKPPAVQRVDYNSTIYCQGVQVCPGDWIVGDGDGTIVIPDDSIEEVVKQARDIEEWEEKQAELIRNRSSMKELKALLKKKHKLKE